MAAEGTRKGFEAALQRAILRLLDTLMAMLAEFQAGRLGAAGSCVSPPLPPPQATAEAGEGDYAGGGRGEEERVGACGAHQEESGICGGGGFKAAIARLAARWIPAFAGMTGMGVAGDVGSDDRKADSIWVAGGASPRPSPQSGEGAETGGDADRGAGSAPLCALGGADYLTAENRGGAALASPANARGALCAAQDEGTPHPPASGPIFAGKNGSPSRAPRRSASRPSPSRGAGTRVYCALRSSPGLRRGPRSRPAASSRLRDCSHPKLRDMPLRVARRMGFDSKIGVGGKGGYCVHFVTLS